MPALAPDPEPIVDMPNDDIGDADSHVEAAGSPTPRPPDDDGDLDDE